MILLDNNILSELMHPVRERPPLECRFRKGQQT